MGLALAAVIKGYRCIFTMADKQSKEKIDILRRDGAEVIVCPTNVEPNPRSYYSTARRLEQEIPNSISMNQYDNMSDTAAHYETAEQLKSQNQQKGKLPTSQQDRELVELSAGFFSILKKKSFLKTIGLDTYQVYTRKTAVKTGIFDGANLSLSYRGNRGGHRSCKLLICIFN